MYFQNWLADLRKTFKPGDFSRKYPAKRCRLSLEHLENRVTPSHTVSIVVPPALDVTNVAEGTPVTLTSNVAGTGTGTVTYNWQVTGGAVTTVGGNTGTSFSFTPNDNAALQVTLTVTDASDLDNNPATDDTHATSATPVNLTVNNVPPQNLAITGPTSAVRGQTLTYTSSFTDPGSADTFTYAWSVTRNGSPFVLPVGTVTNQATFSFIPVDSATYVVSLTVTDDDGGSAVATTTVTVTGAAMQGNDLVVGGTVKNDSIVIVPAPIKMGKGKPTFGVKVLLNGRSLGTFQPTGAIIVLGQAGNDNIQMAGSIQVDGILFGGDGKDRLKGGAGNNVLVGGAGNDLLIGGKNNDLLIGGAGADNLIGGPGDDILIGDMTTFDTNQTALAAILAEWNSSNSYEDRIKNLTGTAGGLNNGNFLILGNTVLTDGFRDKMTGASGLDWFLSVDGTDKITGKGWMEKLNS
jgi:Ca2+-binding RTX toxin-like protein